MKIIGMNKKIFKQLCMNFNKEPDKELYELWEYNLRCYDEEEIQQAISKIIANDKYFPTFSRLLQIVKEVVSKEEFDYNNEKHIQEKMKRLDIHPSWLDKETTNEPIDEQALEIAKLKDDKKRAIEYIKRNYKILLLTEPPKEAFDINELLEILGDKE